MLALLIWIGRVSIGIAAVIYVIVGAAIGYANALDWTMAAAWVPLAGAVLGGLVGLVLAGVTLGLAAAIFDMHHMIKHASQDLALRARMPAAGEPPIFRP